jgi:hypothetical protein
MKRISSLLGGAVLGVALLAACGGGGGGSGTSAPGGPLPPGATPAPAPSTQSFSASDAAAIPTPAPGATSVPVPLPSDPSGASATAVLPTSASVPTDATVAATYSTSADASMPALSSLRKTSALRGAREDGKNGAIVYLKLQFSADVSMPQAPGFTFVVPGALPTDGVSYWLAFLDPLRTAAGWQKGFEGPATVASAQTASGKSATKLTFASNGQPITFVAGQSYYFAVIAVPTSTATPTPVPSTVPTNPPHDAKPAPVLASPANVQFAAVTDSPVPVTFSQQGFTGTFQLRGDCTGIVNTSGASPTFTITPVAQGRCVLIGLGDRGASAVIHVGVVTPFETPHPQSSSSPRPTDAPTTSPTTAPSHSPEPQASKSPEPQASRSPEPEPSHTPGTEPSHSPEPTSAPSSEPSHSPEPAHSASPTPTPGTNPNA